MNPNVVFHHFVPHSGAVMEGMRVSGDKKLMCTISHDQTIKFWRTNSWPSAPKPKKRKIKTCNDDSDEEYDFEEEEEEEEDKAEDQEEGGGGDQDQDQDQEGSEEKSDPNDVQLSAEAQMEREAEETVKQFITTDTEEKLQRIMKIKKIRKWKIKSKRKRPNAATIAREVFGRGSATKFWSGL